MDADKLREGDLVVITGSTIKREGDPDINHMIGRVVAVGKQDIFAMDADSTYKSYRTFRVSKSRCIQIDNSCVTHDKEILSPKLGDLVMSIVDKFGNQDKKIGVLTEIIDVPGRAKMGRILKGETIEVASMESMIVLE